MQQEMSAQASPCWGRVEGRDLPGYRIGNQANRRGGATSGFASRQSVGEAARQSDSECITFTSHGHCHLYA
jgi:hypothetical protein